MAKKPTKRTKKHSHKLRQIKTAQYLVNDVLVVTVIDVVDKKLVPRTFAMKKGTCQVVKLSDAQKKILYDIRHSWCFFSAVACRKQDGSRYIHDASEAFINEQCNLADLTQMLADTLFDKFNGANPLHALTAYWISVPNDHDFTLREMLAPLYYRNVYDEYLTSYELETGNKDNIGYKADSLEQFILEWRGV